MRLGIVSYCDHLRTYAHFNHQTYADMHGYTYIFDIAPTKHTHYFSKIDKISKFLDLFDWVFWIDDDAFFTNFDYDLSKVVAEYPNADFIFCKSPVNEGQWTFLSSGNFFVRNTKTSRQLLESMHTVDLHKVRQWWDSDRFGTFTNGDQDVLVYLLHTRTNPPNFVVLDYEAFNNRPFHYSGRLNEHFVVHFTGADKGKQAATFAQKFDLEEDLVPERLRNAYLGKASRHKAEKKEMS